MRIALRAAVAATSALLLAACGTTQPGASLSPSAPTEIATPSVSASPTEPSPSESPSSQTSTQPSTSTEPQGDPIVLNGKGLTGAPFGTAEDDVEALLNAHAGKPQDTNSGVICELDDGSPYGRQYDYGSVFVQTASKRGGKASSARTLFGWSLRLDQPMAKGFAIDPSYPTDATVPELQKKFPKAKLTKVALGDSVFYTLKTPSGIFYTSETKAGRPDIMGAGPITTCE